jgi:hypothetical protein
VKSGDGALSFVLNTLDSIGNKDPRCVDHRLCRCLAFSVGGLLRTEQ